MVPSSVGLCIHLMRMSLELLFSLTCGSSLSHHSSLTPGAQE
uniref:Uncharacterized protein n=1 Tax=Anguilla anguilla TaxID=7936 RepID=A0A0E9PSQ2_ANGAN